ncbi:FkbM family methyltransferase [Streptomyces sp. Qhu-G9]|uniref:FkbM family methyltransferase n=1 Tax=Streptomyces sp. Qhu-G9 TaxID=3452799 RepID=UPI0022AC1EDA|nr:FkbM family methyltransferase [Streptomyces aurantiacus]WAU78691.1 FkbM family methyltransferase [Streptomyces aurantiacus]
MQTLYRRLLRILPRIGVKVVDVGPGTAVVFRRGDRTVLPVGSGADLVTHGKGRYAVTDAGADTWVVARGSTKRSMKSVPFGDTGARLLLDEEVPASGEREFQLAAAHYLCTQHVAALLELNRVNCVFDVGANTGQYGKGLRRFGYTGRIVSFEPVSDTFAKLQRSAEKDPDWHVYNFALGREEAVQSISIDWKSMNSLLPPSEYGKERYKRFAKGRTEEIEIRRLDDVLQKALEGIADPRPYLKMDTQGFDMEVFAGAGERISEFVGMQSEVAALQLYEGSPGMGEAIAAYEAAGFGVTGMYPVTREPATGRVVEFDCVMMRPESSEPVTG